MRICYALISVAPRIRNSVKPMTSASFDNLSPSDQLGRLCDLERAEDDEQGTDLDSLVEAFRE